MKRILFLVGLCLLLSGCVTENLVRSAASTSREEAPVLCGLYEVVRVSDGDTIVVQVDGEEVSVRLIGVDAPESVHFDDSKNTPEGAVASQWTCDLLDDAFVYLEYDVEKTDKYGRTLAYVYLDDGVTMVERSMLADGMAQVMTIQPNSKYADEFVEIQKNARENEAGFWGDSK